MFSLSLLSLLSGSYVSAGPLEDLENELKDYPKCLTIVKTAIASKAKPYEVDWSQFDFKNKEDDLKATYLNEAFDRYLGKIVNEKFEIKAALSGKGKLFDEGYQRAQDEYEYFVELRENFSTSWSAAFTKAFME